ncbi:replicative DNA helicase [Petrotoga mexicana DSM 14811]|uniref:Replicative DNA helicase n=2 Tax=Petrotoga TaxID=28236 RepID=A0A2K1P7N0_9BACT|nr:MULTISPECIES: replicative DNA helicase [Petrotoga]KUK16158.1 MAG: Replicative DNA helicase [Petrotoga mobilis]PNR98789.1 replicative DNA helicase [Petrotoga mexicana DSM 14811]PNS01956.1 replicative DNA helicase [Petrotoga miotherma DSM 10691]HBT50859.1 replicative DNA helicase [Petrotoga sp.]
MELTSFTPPNSKEAEESVIGSIFLDPSILPDVIEEVRWEDFYYENNKIIFKVMEELFDKGEPVDTVSVIEKLRESNLLQKIGGEDTIIYLAQVVPTTANVMYYTQIVKEKALLRALINASSEIVDAVRNIGDAQEVLEYAEKRIFSIAEARATRTYDLLSNVMHDVFEQIEELKNRAQKGEGDLVTGVSTGFKALDRMTSGFHRSELIIIAARPSMGKTSFAANIATNMALQANVAVAIFSLEMSKEQLANRILCSEAKVDLHKVRTGQISDEEWEKLVQKAGELSKSRLIFDDEPDLTPRMLRAKARRMKREYGIEVIFIDYLQLMTSRSKGYESRQQEITDISRSLKLLARELNITVVALSQLSRAVEQREDKRPRLSDLRESGAIEQDADVVMFLYRDSYYKRKKDEPGKDSLNDEHEAELIVGKQRNGPVGTIKLTFNPKLATFYTSDRGYQ